MTSCYFFSFQSATGNFRSLCFLPRKLPHPDWNSCLCLVPIVLHILIPSAQDWYSFPKATKFTRNQLSSHQENMYWSYACKKTVELTETDKNTEDDDSQTRFSWASIQECFVHLGFLDNGEKWSKICLVVFRSV